MKIWMIWSRDPNTDELTLVDAWDDDSVSDNSEGWLETLSKAEQVYGGRFIRVATTYIDLEAVRVNFEPVSA